MGSKNWGSSNRVIDDGGPVQQRVITHAHEPGRIYTHREQRNKDVIYERNQSLRNEPGSMKDLSFGRQVADIPIEDFYDLVDKNPELKSPDKEIRKRAMARILKDPANRKFLVVPKY